MTRALAFAVAFALRLAFGLVSEFWGDDELQIYLIGLQFYTTGIWPLFGPDVVYTQTQIPGGLQGLLVGGPLWVAPVPEAPYVLLNMISFASLLLLGWYILQRTPAMPRWFLWPWVFFSPWTLNLSAHVVNPSYVLSGAILFFVGAFEIVPALRRGVVSHVTAGFLAGFGVFWVYQLHLSAALLAVVAAIALVLAARANRAAALRSAGGFAAGALLSGATLLPTLVQVGLAGVLGSTSANVEFAPSNLLRLPQIAGRFFSFACFEVARFLGSSTAERLEFLARYLWASPFIFYAAIAGLAQTGSLIVLAVAKRRGEGDWSAIRDATLALLVLVTLSFVGSIRSPASHAFYALTPAVFIFAASCWAPLLRLRVVRIAAVMLFVASAVTYTAIALRNFTDRSLYRDRPRIIKAIDQKDYRIVGERRPSRAPLPPR
jgi:hypothetical protein